jgi:hypothetical protein
MKFVTFRIAYDFGEGTQKIVYDVRAASYQHAAWKCAKTHPGCRVLPGERRGDDGSVTHYEGISTASIVAEPAPETEQANFAFVDQCKGKRQCDVVDWNESHGIRIRRPI